MAQLKAKDKLDSLLGPLGTDVEDRLSRIAWLAAEADAPLVDDRNRLDETISNTTDRRETKLATLAGIPGEMDAIAGLRVEAEVLITNAQSDQAELKQHC